MLRPWTIEERSAKTRKITKEAERVAARLGAKGVVIIATFADGEYLHMLDAGVNSMPLKDLYRMMVANHEKVEAGAEGYVS